MLVSVVSAVSCVCLSIVRCAAQCCCYLTIVLLFQSVEAAATELQVRFETAVLEQRGLHDLACKGE
jgi:hypothetical protein